MSFLSELLKLKPKKTPGSVEQTHINHVKKEPKLTIELVPETCWGSNLRSNVSKEDWDVLRKECYKLAHYRCEVCNGVGREWPVEAHEIWDYNDNQHHQTLTRLIALCPACHEVKHIGFATINERLDQAAKHLAEVNGWQADEAQNYIETQFNIWTERSQYEWTLDISWLSNKGITVRNCDRPNRISNKPSIDNTFNSNLATNEVRIKAILSDFERIINDYNLLVPVFIQDFKGASDICKLADYPLAYAWIERQDKIERTVIAINDNAVARVLGHIMNPDDRYFQSVKKASTITLEKITEQRLSEKGTPSLRKLEVMMLNDLKNKTFTIPNENKMGTNLASTWSVHIPTQDERVEIMERSK